MEYDNQNPKKYYSKKNLWKWILLYIVIGVIAYGAIYYFFFAKNGGYSYNPSQYQDNYQTNNSNSPNQPLGQNPTTTSVTISNFAFNPDSLTIHKGDTVIWKNDDSVDHTITGDNGGPSSQYLSPGNSYSYTFTADGIFPYHCSIHPHMMGTIQVIN